MKQARSIIQDAAMFFFIGGIVFIPFQFHLFASQVHITEFVFGPVLRLATKIFTGNSSINSYVYSDSLSMYLLTGILMILASLLSLFIATRKFWKRKRKQISAYLRLAMCCYIAMILLKYGCGKLFKDQFYLPEPNILFTPLGNLDPDILFWSAMGTSKFYNVFTGMGEMLAAMLLISRRTRLIGLILSWLILLQVCAINFGFDISVKLYSLFLLFMVTYLLVPYLRMLYLLLTMHTQVTVQTVLHSPGTTNIFWKSFLKTLVIGMIMLEVLYPVLTTGSMNDDVIDRPWLHGAYEVQEMRLDSDTIQQVEAPVRRFFIHRSGYIIFQDQHDGMKDFRLEYETGGRYLSLIDYKLQRTVVPFKYSPSDSVLILQYGPYQLTGKALNWRKMPALQQALHWTIDYSR